MLAGTAHVLTSVYAVPRSPVVDCLIDLVQKRNLVTVALDTGAIIQALQLCRPSGRVSFRDAMVWAAARSMGAEAVFSFDERFPEHGIEVRRDR